MFGKKPTWSEWKWCAESVDEYKASYRIYRPDEARKIQWFQRLDGTDPMMPFRWGSIYTTSWGLCHLLNTELGLCDDFHLGESIQRTKRNLVFIGQAV